jgi:UDP-N-acetylmuramoylalanine--D-glutamate ligase
LVWADELNIPVISEIELAWSVCPATVIAVTGTNGKTTVTTLVAKVLETKGARAFALGNIGRPFSQEVKNLKSSDFVSLEVSSFQLERISEFKPKVSVILNFTPNHLDRYGNISEYLNVKKRIFMNQDKDDYSVLNYDDPTLRDLAEEPKAKVVFFGASQNTDCGIKFDLNPNHLAVLAVAQICGVSKEACLDVFKNFKGVEHRLERVREIKDVEFINDSKATNVDSTIWALRNTHKPIILIAGGKDKNSDYRVIADLMRQKVKHLVLIGQAKEKIRSHLDGILPMRYASSLEEAVGAGFSYAKSGDCILFSPMCASFDMFENYEHRGRAFKEIVNRLTI